MRARAIVCVRVCEARAYSRVHTPGCASRRMQACELSRAIRGNHICSVTKLRILHTGLTGLAVTYLTGR